MAEPELDQHRATIQRWLDDHAADLLTARAAAGDLEAEMRYNSALCASLWNTDVARWGWPTEAGGLGGSSLLRAVVAEELALRDVVHPNIYLMPEVLGVAFAATAERSLVGTFMPRYLKGEEWWCQGFSEPGAGSDLASLTTRAEQRGDAFVINGQKVWTTLAQFAHRCVLLARTGPPGSGHRGISAFFVDMDTPGVTVRPLDGMHGEPEFSECFFDDVVVPADRMIGDLNAGWAFAMSVLACERATIFWTRAAWLHQRLARLLDEAGADGALRSIGTAFCAVAALRGRSRLTQHAVAAGAFDAPASSVDKLLMATAEKAVLDAALDVAPESVLFGDDAASSVWRTEYLFSRASSIYGGTREIQQNILAQRCLGLPR